jgi:hypothetical protein
LKNKISSENCANVDDFIKEVKTELLSTLGSFSPGQISIHLTDGGAALEPDGLLPTENTAKSPLYMMVESESDQH